MDRMEESIGLSGCRAAIADVQRYVRAHLDEDLTPHQLADLACFSQHHFHRIFREVVGESVMDHIRRLRMERAAFDLAMTDATVGEIAFANGYQAQEAFTRTFREYYGVAPGAYRRARVPVLLPAALRLWGPWPRVDPSRMCDAHRAMLVPVETELDTAFDALANLAELVLPPWLRGVHHLTEENMTDTITNIDKEIDDLEHAVEAAKQKLTEARRRRPREVVQDYVLKNTDGAEVRLSELFGDKDDLIVVHNMGTGCVYCTLWADGFIGLHDHLLNRAAFVVCSPDKPEVQKKFAAKRGWPFKMVSAHESSFIKDMGFWEEAGQHPGPWPGVSSFRREPDGTISRISKSHFGPGDDYCALWPFLDLLDGGAGDWAPKYSYTGDE